MELKMECWKDGIMDVGLHQSLPT